MYRTASPYIKELIKGEINWHPFTMETLQKAIMEDKMIFVHIGNISNINRRNAAYELFSNKDIIQILNNNFVAVALDTEDVPEAYLIGMDLLLINEQKISDHINIFSLPGIKPVTSFSSLLPDDFLYIANNLLISYEDQRDKLEVASKFLTRRLKFSGVVTEKEAPKSISAKLLHAYIRSWASRFLNKENKIRRAPYRITARNLNFILEYAYRYNITEYLQYIEETLVHVYYSPLFDPIDGGVFSEARDYSFQRPSYEKNIYENANAAILFTTAHKYLKKKIFKEAAERIVHFLEHQMNLHGRGYITYITLSKCPEESTYYKYTLGELRNAFPKKYISIAKKLGMEITAEETTYQTIRNTPQYWEIEHNELETLKKIRYCRKGELILDKRIMTGYNCRTAVAFCIMAKNSRSGEKQQYLQMAKSIIDNIVKHQRKGNLHLYKYISSTRVEYSTSDLYDYSLFLNCLLNYYMITKDETYNNLAKTYTKYIMENHFQPESGMFTKMAKNQAIKRLKRAPVIDYNTLSSNSIMADNLLMLYKVSKGKSIYINTFKQQIYNIEPQLIGSGPFMTGWGMQVLNYLTEYASDTPEKE